MEELQEVELRHPNKARHLDFNSTVKLADDFYMDDDSDLSSQLGKKVGPTVWDHILLNRPVKVVFAMLIAVLVVPTLLYGFMYGLAPDMEPFGSCIILEDYWSECMPGQQPSQQECLEVGCCWNLTSNACHHSLPARHNYQLLEADLLTPRLQRSPLGCAALALRVQAGALSPLHALVHLSTSNDTELTFVDSERIEVEVVRGQAFYVSMWRKQDTNRTDILFSTNHGPLVATDGFWEWSLQFPEEAVLLGAGASSRGFLHLGAASNAALYQSLRAKTAGRPFVLCILPSGKAHGVLFEASGALEIVTRPSNLISLRTTAGKGSNLQVHTFVGDNPAEVFDALTQHTGRPSLPAYWALGLHVCRDAAREAAANSSLLFQQEAELLELPFDSDCVDDSALGNATFVVEEERLTELLEGIAALHEQKRHLLLSVFSQVAKGTSAFVEAMTSDLLLRVLKTQIFTGEHRGRQVGYPDFKDPATAAWLRTNLQTMLSSLADAMPSGLVLPDNWPLDEVDDGGAGTPYYVPQGLEGYMSNGTVWWDANGQDGVLHQDAHNQYGAAHAAMVQEIFLEVLAGVGKSNVRVPVLSASNWIGSPVRGLLGEEQIADWVGLKGSLLSVLEAGLSGEPFSGGGAICGASGNWTATLCTRWSLLALSTFPLARYHHRWGEPGRDPTFMDESSARIVARAARLRYELLPYIYTHMREASLTGMPLVRPMAVEFPDDNSTWTLDEQFMVGPSLMAAPVLQPEAVSLTIHLPNATASWYHLQGGEAVAAPGESLTLLAPENELILLIRGGHIIALQDAGVSSQLSRGNSRQVIAALECDEVINGECSASGRLWLDDGVSVDSPSGELLFSATATSLTMTPPDVVELCGDATLATVVNAVSVYGLPGKVRNDVQILVNDVPVPDVKVIFEKELSRLRIESLLIDWCQYQGNVTVQWQMYGPN